MDPTSSSPPDRSVGGLTTIEARERLRRFGPNAIVERPPRYWLLLLRKFWGVIPWMLEAAIILELYLSQWAQAAEIGALLVFQAGIGYYNEQRAKKAIALLRQRLSVTARVERDGQWQVLPAAELVPGDQVHLRVGDIVPADISLTNGEVLVDQSMLTGESVPVPSGPGASVYTGAILRRGEATGTVTATGGRTFYGRTAELVRLAQAPKRLQMLTVRIAKYLLALDAALIIAVALEAALEHVTQVNILPFVLMLLVASVPVALPSMFTMSASMGSRALGEHGVLTTRLSAVEDAASLDVLCVDKTGTITENHLSVDAVVALDPSSSPDEVLRWAAIASDAATQDPIDLAILDRLHEKARLDGPVALPRTRFEPFDPSTKRSEATIQTAGGELHVVKGEPTTIAGLVGVPWDRIGPEVARLSAGGARVLAVATGVEGALRLVGLVSLYDPPRSDTQALVRDLMQQGVRVVMVTGDGEATARAVAAKVGIPGAVAPAGTIHEGLDATTAERYSIYPGVLPQEKFFLVRALQRAGHVVGMTGDGVNDAPALGQADVGVAVSTATDVAKASASMVLTRPGLGAILAAIRTSRGIYQRMQTWVVAMLTRKAAVPPFLALGLLLFGTLVLTPSLIVLFMIFGDIATFALASDNVAPSNRPDRWNVRGLVGVGLGYAAGLFVASNVVFWAAFDWFSLPLGQAQTVTFVWLMFAGGQAALYVARARRAFWARPFPSRWLLGVSLFDGIVVALMAVFGWLMAPISWEWVVAVFLASVAYLAWSNGLSLWAKRLSGSSRPEALVGGAPAS
ncbi:MAG: plasma-membrane proton-efflux P-type ATPase [Candidatus Thermoplasmatota archaeon]|jgi:H+-transporting ATPase|nr:plasma-membrane proton-efflux P-type ATPase [Candidatus Thermoplasmatota archaeon]